MKATREQVTEMLVQTGLIEPGCWLVDGNKYEALVHLAQQFTLDQLRKDGEVRQYPNSRQLPAVMESLYRIPEALE